MSEERERAEFLSSGSGGFGKYATGADNWHYCGLPQFGMHLLNPLSLPSGVWCPLNMLKGLGIVQVQPPMAKTATLTIWPARRSE